MKTKIIVIAVIGVLVIGGGLSYAHTKTTSNDRRPDLTQMGQEGQIGGGQGPTGEMPDRAVIQEGQMPGDQEGVPSGMPEGQIKSNQDAPSEMPDRQGAMGNRTVGEIISKNDTSITVKLPDGSSRIVLISSSAVINKMTEGSITAGSITDLVVGENVMVVGETNADGNINAQSIQIIGAFKRPAGGQAPAMPV